VLRDAEHFPPDCLRGVLLALELRDGALVVAQLQVLFSDQFVGVDDILGFGFTCLRHHISPASILRGGRGVVQGRGAKCPTGGAVLDPSVTYRTDGAVLVRLEKCPTLLVGCGPWEKWQTA